MEYIQLTRETVDEVVSILQEIREAGRVYDQSELDQRILMLILHLGAKLGTSGEKISCGACGATVVPVMGVCPSCDKHIG